MTATTHNLFVYGTLQYPAIAAAVAGRSLEGECAVLDGFGRFAIRGEPFPGIVPSPGDAVEGLLYTGVDGSIRRRIEAWEGGYYRRDAITVRRHTDGIEIAAETFVVRPRWRHILMHTGWDVEAFEREWHDAYLRELGALRGVHRND